MHPPIPDHWCRIRAGSRPSSAAVRRALARSSVHPWQTLTTAAALLALAGCAPSGEDVRVSFCKEIVRTQVRDPAAVNFTRAATNPRGPAGLTVSLTFTEGGDGGQRQAICQYRHNAVDDTAQTLADPLSAYATSPESVTIDGTGLSRAALAAAVGRALGRQGQATLETLRATAMPTPTPPQPDRAPPAQAPQQAAEPAPVQAPVQAPGPIPEQAPAQPATGALGEVLRGLEQAVQPGGALDQARAGLEQIVRPGGPLDQARQQLEAATRPGGALDQTRQGLEQAARQGGAALERALGELTRAVQEGTTTAEQALMELRAVTQQGAEQVGSDLSAAVRDSQAALERTQAELEAQLEAQLPRAAEPPAQQP